MALDLLNSGNLEQLAVKGLSNIGKVEVSNIDRLAATGRVVNCREHLAVQTCLSICACVDSSGDAHDSDCLFASGHSSIAQPQAVMIAGYTRSLSVARKDSLARPLLQTDRSTSMWILAASIYRGVWPRRAPRMDR